MQRKIIIFVLISALVICYGCGSDKPLKITKESAGVTVEIETVAGELGRGECSKLMKKAADVFDQRIKLGFGKNNVIEKLNTEREVSDIPDEMIEFFERIDQLRQRTNKAWYPATGKIHESWNSLDSDALEPLPEDLSIACVQAQSTGIRLPMGNKAILHGEGLLSLDYALVGWSVDGAAEVLKVGGVPAAFIKAGEVYRFWGQPAMDSLWTFRIIAFPDTSIYELIPDAGGLCRIINYDTSIDYKDILNLNEYNPQTGYPAVNELTSLSAWGSDAISACIYAEAANVMSRLEMLKWANEHDSVSVFIIHDDLEGAVAESDNRMSPWVSMYLP
ncbi:FAD:protein FMN transferase [bacterium]|nr:FAD:protein FMN transferase [bacterium]